MRIDLASGLDEVSGTPFTRRLAYGFELAFELALVLGRDLLGSVGGLLGSVA